jgi:hypothetical protein
MGCGVSHKLRVTPQSNGDYPMMSIRMSLRVQQFPLLAMTFSLS